MVTGTKKGIAPAALGLLGLWLGLAPAHGQIVLSGRKDYSALGGNHPVSVAVGDLDGDGTPDLVSVNNGGSGSVNTFLNNGDGTFSATLNYPAGSMPMAAVVADLTGDGLPDIATANSGGTINVLTNLGRGIFNLLGSQYAAGTKPVAIAVADPNHDYNGDGQPDHLDFDGDGKADLVVVNGGLNGGITILLNQGNGTFSQSHYYATGPNTNPVSVVVGEFTGDNNLDIAVANYTAGTVSLFRGHGDGTFDLTSPAGFPAGSAPQGMSAADFNRDGKMDLVVGSNSTSGGLNILLGNGDGTFRAPLYENIGAYCVSTSTGDFNGDGKPDIVAGSASPGDVIHILTGHGDGRFDASVDTVTTGTLSFVQAVDLNGDGVSDVAAGNYGNSISTFFNTTTFIASVDLAPDAVQEGGVANGTITLTRPAPVNGSTITLTSVNSDVAAPPTTVIVPEGKTAIGFFVAAKAPGDTQITATLNNQTKATPLTVTSTPSILHGDANNDGVIDIQDAILDLRITAGIDTPR